MAQEQEPTMTTAEELRLAVATDVLVWFETMTHIRSKTGAMIRPVANVLQRRVIEAIEWCEANEVPARIVVVKPRKTGISTIIQGLIAHRSRVRPNLHSLTLGDEFGTTEYLDDIFETFLSEDEWPWTTQAKATKERVEFSNGAIRHRETARDPNAGRGGTFQLVHATEVAHYPMSGASSAERLMLGLRNSVAEVAGTIIVEESTPNGVGNIFHATYHGDPAAENPLLREGAVTLEERKKGKLGNGYIKVFAAWWEFPEYSMALSDREAAALEESMTDEEWTAVERFDLTAEQLAWRRATIQKSGGLRQFQQEFPEDDVSCFLFSGRPRFDHAGMTRLEGMVNHRKPTCGHVIEQTTGGVEFQVTSEEEATVLMWEPPATGRSYLVTIDTMTGASQTEDGETADTNSVLVLRAPYGGTDGAKHNLALVARLKGPNRLDPGPGATLAARLAKLYGDCIVVPEINNSGLAWVERLKDAGAIIYHRERFDEERQVVTKKLGWQTTTQTRYQIIEALAGLIRSDAIDAWDPHLTRQLRTFVRKPSGREEAADGNLDDDVIAMAIGCQCLPLATRMTQRARPRRRRVR